MPATFLAICACLILALPGRIESQPVSYSLQSLEGSKTPLITKSHPASAGNQYGYEGGIVFKYEDAYHMFVTEMFGSPLHVPTRTGHWRSADGLLWERLGEVETSGRPTDAGCSSTYPQPVWSPIPMYNDKEGRWNLFYLVYSCIPVGNKNGKVLRAVANTAGPGGLHGPYTDAGTLLAYDNLKESWEGSQGISSFYPFAVNGKYYAFYGSADGATHWESGIATTDSLAGAWTRYAGTSDMLTFSENPLVTRMEDGNYLCVFDAISMDGFKSIGYAYSLDGIHWTQKTVNLSVDWVAINIGAGGDIRTPQSLIDEGNGVFTVFFSGKNSANGYFEVGRVKLKLTKTGTTALLTGSHSEAQGGPQTRVPGEILFREQSGTFHNYLGRRVDYRTFPFQTQPLLP